ncbi:MAG: preprotein translocase subunit SecG [Phycisphaerales bacterium JB065]
MITLASQLWIGLGIVGFLFISLMMILIVLIQKPQGGGLSGAFGSSSDGGAGQTAFGAKTGDVLTTMTISIFVLFLVTAAGLNYVVRPSAAAADQETAASSTDDGTESSGAEGGTNSPIQIDGGSASITPLDQDESGAPIPVPTPGQPEGTEGDQPEDQATPQPENDPQQPAEDPAQPDENTGG